MTSPSPDSLVILTNDPSETESLASRMAGLLRGNEVIFLSGTLGSGKTCFVRGLARGLGITEPAVSPTFTLVNEYCGGRPLCHVDLYRLEHPGEVAALGLEEIAGASVVVIEWPERLPPGFLVPDVSIDFQVTGPSGRRLTVRIPNPGLRGGMAGLTRPAG